MKHLVDKTILVPFREELKYAVCIVSGRRARPTETAGPLCPGLEKSKNLKKA